MTKKYLLCIRIYGGRGHFGKTKGSFLGRGEGLFSQQVLDPSLI